MPATLLIFDPDSPADTAVYAAGIARQFPGLQVVATGSLEAALEAAPAAEVLVAKAQDINPALVARMPGLRWIQALTTGVDPLYTLALPAAVTVTSARGIHGPQMAELALLGMLSLYRDFPRMLANQRTRAWRRWPQRLLHGKTVVIVGVGAISEQLAVRSRAFGMRVAGVSGRTRVDGFDELFPRERLHAAAAQADFLVLVTPYTPATHHLIDAGVLAAMRPTSYLLNIARGKVVDEAALIEALRARRIAGAALDVFATEPLPADSPLWEMDNVIVTPHIGGMSDIYAEQILPVLLHNLGRFLAGDFAAMHNLVSFPH